MRTRTEGGWGEKEPGKIRRDSRGRVEDMREGATPMGNQQPQSQDLAPQRNRRII